MICNSRARLEKCCLIFEVGRCIMKEVLPTKFKKIDDLLHKPEIKIITSISSS